MTEANSLTNFNFGFSTHKSDVLIHLSQWQYWWWFWFSLVWVVYLFIVTKTIHKRTLQFNPIVNTSIRGHGKWGDFLVAIIPLSWCGNILVNSNFILRMIEWQNEGSLFTLRVQGKQWYWVYKFDAISAEKIINAPKNIGNNNWVSYNPFEDYNSDSDANTIQLAVQAEYKKLYFKFLSDDKLTKKNIERFSQLSNILIFSEKNIPSAEGLHIDANFKTINLTRNYNLNTIDDTSDYSKNLVESVKKKPLSILKGGLNKHNLALLRDANVGDKPIFFVSKFWLPTGSLETKPEDSEFLWGFKQKKYKRLQNYKFSARVEYDPKTFLPINTEEKFSPFTLKSTLTVDSLHQYFNQSNPVNKTTNLIDYHNSVKFNRHRSELVPVNLARRLLRTKRTLVLPAHVNITVITNSYDVVHSWFIPGLGLKLDCVPGRSTHHSFYIDNVGFYYGQCAEICGRYHHHMPIRLCALPFEQFLVWWKHRGIKRVYRLVGKKTFNIPQAAQFRYVW